MTYVLFIVGCAGVSFLLGYGVGRAIRRGWLGYCSAEHYYASPSPRR